MCAPGTESLHHLSRTLATVHSVAARVVADVVTDAALVLYAEAKPLLNGVYCKRDQEAELVLGILRTLHACFEAVDLDDAVLRLSVSLKLALLLEEQDGGGTDQLHQARDVLRSTRVVVERFRCEASLMMRGQPHEHLHWITASRNQPNDAVAKLVSAHAVRHPLLMMRGYQRHEQLHWVRPAGTSHTTLWPNWCQAYRPATRCCGQGSS
ncbi:hypothetical protein DUNSADRAFT_7305 [Dunaliella salina]|uniref:Uncharacterized protein n=1 Tax=Dunaliella salina TaxID=3046 RepID=A0ABQ7FTD1_DUNSA|nr:hypothetical protein DUNSADRAFT_7305 [Dunaliella salina]|eukprot:KAF5825725.1 hypothetical protein DUNSADRAFT_7305 [Dunaliella salina]